MDFPARLRGPNSAGAIWRGGVDRFWTGRAPAIAGGRWRDHLLPTRKRRARRRCAQRGGVASFGWRALLRATECAGAGSGFGAKPGINKSTFYRRERARGAYDADRGAGCDGDGNGRAVATVMDDAAADRPCGD